MTQTPLNQSIFRLVVGLVLLTAITTFINVWIATDEQTRERLNRDFSIAENVLQRVLHNREELLYVSASVLTADFGFKQAVASGDKGTIDSALFNHGQRIEADLMALVSLKGNSITSVPAVLKVDQNFPYPEVIDTIIKEGGYSSLMMLNNQLYQVIMLTIDAPTPIAIALVGFKLGDPILALLKEITQLETTLQVYSQQNEIFKISTLPAPLAAQALAQINERPSWLSITVTKDTPYVSQQFTLSDALEHQTVITLSEDAEQLFADFTSLQFNITALGVIVILLAALLAALFSRRISKPLVVLADIAKRIAIGDYSTDANVPTKTKEVSLLSEAFGTMQNNIQAREEEIIYRVRHDALTTLFNRQHVKSLLEQRFLDNAQFLAIGINIFGFRGINDIFGYHNGDRCLKELALRLSQFDGVAARLTGGELLWLPTDEPSEEFIQSLKTVLEEPFDTGKVIINIKVAMGLIYCPKDANNAEEVFKRLNIVLDEAQITRKFVLPFSPELEERYSRRLAIITELKNTLEHAIGELSLNYQPKLDLQKGKVTHVEALIRWTNARLGFVSPEVFIGIAEQAGFIENITSWVINRAIDDAAKFRDAKVDVSVAINLSAKDIMDPALLPRVLGLLKAKNLSTECLSFEITEGDLVKDHDKAISHLQAFRDQGFEIAIDDFGTGYSSMAYLQNLPVNTLKVDKSFVLKLHQQDGDQKIVKTVISLAHSFDMNVVAEGVETIEALTLLAEWGCELAQGYYICKPTPADNFITWYNENLNTKWL
ncbi:sensor domain-containing phosphodiesterase [Paraglaciecola arctica]|uniref:Diguanylate cyclase/phosphodiesterase n=1 Tax=Paraglaciecola arctica BSs20135 TaxID=493475 RepID=K6XKV2_9ALTE|nr:sensor domain-containing phosphodiesterase [Paraglaciecola arctica]GAC21279.1 diguanylate cyclase/phosphodiesterase [Paraglaciecola arctica BSs20135]